MSKRKLFSVTIKDCNVETFTVGGPGGGGKDTSNTGVRITHPPSGATAISVDSRSQLKNKQAAFKRMAESKPFQAWVRQKAANVCARRGVEDIVAAQMQPKNLKIEHRTENGWEQVDE